MPAVLIAATYSGLIVLFGSVLVRAVRDGGRANVDAALFFGFVAAASAIGLIEGPARSSEPGPLQDVRQLLALALPMLLLRLLGGFASIPGWATGGAAIGYVIAAPVLLLLADVTPLGVLLPGAYLLLTLAYAAGGFVWYARRTSGVTRRRMQSISLGSSMLLLVALVSLLYRFFPQLSVEGIASVGTLVAGLAYYFGIATPSPVRRVWQYAALTQVLRLLARTPASLPLAESIPLLNRGLAIAFGAPNAAILVWDAGAHALVLPGERLADYPDYHPPSALVTRVFESQRAQYFEDAPLVDPANAPLYARMGSNAVMIAPIRTPARPVGVVALYSPRSSVFSREDVGFLETVSEQLAAFFVRHELVQQAVQVEAQAEATRLKEDFLAAAAHDLRTPLTGILGRAQLLLRRAQRESEASPQRIEDLRALVADGKRMQRLTEGLLEVSRLEHGFTADRVPTDLRALSEEVIRVSPHRQTIEVVGDAAAEVDVERFRQVLQNLLDNAVKFTPGNGRIEVVLESTPDLARVSVVDSGLGVAADEVDTIFERFQRGSAAQHGLMGGMGVGLYLCRRIVEEHGGTIRAERRPEGGSRFVVELPVPGAVPERPIEDLAPDELASGPATIEGDPPLPERVPAPQPSAPAR
jgi:signal transduction histidine kinase